MTDLIARWANVVGEHPTTADHGGRLLARWSEPHRRYHDAEHLRAVLDRVDELVDAEPATPSDPDAVRLAAFFHDAVYDPAGRDNETASADLARTVLEDLGLAEERVREVVRLVLLTATHDVDPDDGNGAVLCDADLAVLAADPETYAAYAVAVREEYAHVPEPLFLAGRVGVLTALLEHDPLYLTRSGRAWWEATARRNVGAELVLLMAQAGGGVEPDATPPRGAG